METTLCESSERDLVVFAHWQPAELLHQYSVTWPRRRTESKRRVVVLRANCTRSRWSLPADGRGRHCSDPTASPKHKGDDEKADRRGADLLTSGCCMRNWRNITCSKQSAIVGQCDGIAKLSVCKLSWRPKGVGPINSSPRPSVVELTGHNPCRLLIRVNGRALTRLGDSAAILQNSNEYYVCQIYGLNMFATFRANFYFDIPITEAKVDVSFPIRESHIGPPIDAFCCEMQVSSLMWVWLLLEGPDVSVDVLCGKRN